MLKAYADCFKIPNLRKKIFFTLGILALCRLAATVPCPGIDGEQLKLLFDSLSNRQSGGGNDLLGMFNLFTGGALQRFAIATLGIMPYITASIIMQLMTPIFPTLASWKREGESGHQKINQWTRYITLGICIVQGYISATVMENPSALLGGSVPEGLQVVISPGMPFRIMTVIILTCGTMLLMWLGEQITDRGVGNGASLIITIGILEQLPSAVYTMNGLVQSNEMQGIVVIILIALFVLVTAGTVALTRGIRRIPLSYARATTNRQGQAAATNTSYFPLKVNFSSVMPIIFAQALLMFPPFLIGYMTRFESMRWAERLTPFVTYGTSWYMLIYAVLLVLFTFFWVANQFNPDQIAEDLKRSNAYVPSCSPGKQTAALLDYSMTRVTAAAAFFLVVLALLPMVISEQLHIPMLVSMYFGGSSLLIIVGVVLDTLDKVKGEMSDHGYDDYKKRGRGRPRRA